jgi:hypothetical protein
VSDDFYYDDPIEENYEPHRKAPMVLAMLLLVVTGSFFLKSTLAANINIVSSNPIDFGQGMEYTTLCSGSNPITVKPAASFINASGGGAHYLTSVTVSGIPSTCNGKDFAISVFSASGNTAAPLLTGTSSPISTAVVYSNGGTFQEGFQTAGATISSGSGTFTVTFPTPLALTSSIAKLTIQSTEHTKWDCSVGATCSIGDTGPGGGTVFFVSTGFSCGPTAASTCKFLEVAPANWAGGSEPLAKWSINHQYDQVVGTGGMTSDGTNYSLASIGRGYLNSVAIVTQGNDNTTAAGMARAYSGGGLSDWYLPNISEINQLCQWSVGQTPAVGVLCNGGSLNNSRFKAQNAGLSSSGPYWTSSEAMYLYGYYFKLDSVESYGDYKNRQYQIRPIRAF